MALLAESVVEEWLNRRRFFTIRGVKHGVGEMDILAVRRETNGKIAAWHVEVQVSFRPVGYICPPRSAKQRTSQEIAQCAGAWVEKKFLVEKKVKEREQFWQGLEWKFLFVHGVVRDNGELEAIKSNNVRLMPFINILDDLHTADQKCSAFAAGDLVEILRYYQENAPIVERMKEFV
jgi:hypothetical protein